MLHSYADKNRFETRPLFPAKLKALPVAAIPHSCGDVLSATYRDWIGGACSTYGVHEVLVRGNLRARDHLEDPDVDGRIILRWIFRKWDGGAWTASIWFRIGAGGGYM